MADYANKVVIERCMESVKKITESILNSQFELGISHEDKNKIYQINFLADSILKKEVFNG